MTHTEELAAFVQKYTRLAKARVRAFLARNPRPDARWLGQDLLQSAYIGIVQAFQSYDSSLGTPEHAWVGLKIDYAILQCFDSENPVPARDIAKLRRYQEDRANYESIRGRKVTLAEYADWDMTTDRRLADFLQLAGLQVMPVDDELLHSRHFQNGSRLDTLVLRKEVMACIRDGLSALSQREKFIVKSLYVDGKSLRQTGKVLGIRKQSVAGARDAILEKLKRRLRRAGIDV
ncbi:MAG: sigma-70 family RNA polymerase sigma factor [Desulfovibrio sp.]|nr:sigma-70 family RNA polymerase sigma factor [Desulfovibrio sp.]